MSETTYFIIFCISAGICDACMDTIAHHWSRSWLERISKKIGQRFYRWMRSHWADKPVLKWYDPRVFFVDGWHTFKTLEFLSITAAFYVILPVAATFFLFWGTTKTTFYEWILLRNKNG